MTAPFKNTVDARLAQDPQVDAILRGLEVDLTLVPVTNGDAGSPEIVFDDGDVVLEPEIIG